MKTEMYNEIMMTIRNFRGLSKDCAKMLKEKFNE